MKIEHVAIWVNDLEGMRDFYKQYFNGEEKQLISQFEKQFESYFITFEGGARLELMKQVGIDDVLQTQTIGYAHIAFSVGSKEKSERINKYIKRSRVSCGKRPTNYRDGYL